MENKLLLCLVVIFLTVVSNPIDLSLSVAHAKKQQRCTTNADCDDNNICTDDQCKGRTCKYTYNTDPCDDGLFCTLNDRCNDGNCRGADRDCSTTGDQCNDGVCDDIIDQCVAQPNVDGTSCNDGTYCTENDVCSQGVCSGSPNDDLCNDNNICTENICTIGVGCSNPVVEYTISLTPDPITLEKIGEHTVLTAFVQEKSLASEGVEVSFAESSDPDNVIQPLPMDELDLNGAASIRIHGISLGLGLLSLTVVDENGHAISGIHYTLEEPLDSCAALDEPTQTIAILNLPCDTEMTVLCKDDMESPIEGYLIASIDPSSAVTGEVVPETNTSGEARVYVAGTAEGQATVTAFDACNAATDETTVTVLDILVTDDDRDGDGILDPDDNCPDEYNPNQEDTYPPQKNGIGDACECEADFNGDGDVDTQDMTSFLGDFGRSAFFSPCSESDPCYGDFDCDVNVDTDDVTMFLEDFGRSKYYNPCPASQSVDWCVYP